jgi:hypothetical protein
VGGTVTEGVATARQKYRPAGLTASRENGTLKYYSLGTNSKITGNWGTNWELIPSYIIEGIVKAGLMESRKATGTAVFSIGAIPVVIRPPVARNKMRGLTSTATRP